MLLFYNKLLGKKARKMAEMELFFYYITSFYSFEENIFKILLKKVLTMSVTIPYNFFEFHLSV